MVIPKKNTNGALILDANTGLPTRADAPSYLGHFNPDWTFGFTNTFKYKNLSLTVGIDGSFGGVMESVVVEKMWWGGKHPNSVQYRDAEYDQVNTHLYQTELTIIRQRILIRHIQKQ